MFEKLTAFIPKLQDTIFGMWNSDQKNDGSPQQPMQFPYVNYEPVVLDFEKAVYCFIDQHKEMELTRYREILANSMIEWDSEAMKNAVVSLLDGKTVMALIVGAIRAERFCSGALLDFCKNGSLTKWLSRLQQIDSEKQI